MRLLAASIALVAGFVDAIGFVGYGGTFVSFMSGNSTRLGAHSAAAEWDVVLLTAGVVAAFVAGVALGQAFGSARDRTRRARVLWLVASALGIGAFVAEPLGPFAAVLAAAFGMGAINTVFASSPLPVGLTYMTGTLVKLGQSLGQRLRGETPPREGPYLLHWLALVAGAALGAMAYAQFGFAALWAATSAVAFMAWRSPRVEA